MLINPQYLIKAIDVFMLFANLFILRLISQITVKFHSEYIRNLKVFKIFKKMKFQKFMHLRIIVINEYLSNNVAYKSFLTNLKEGLKRLHKFINRLILNINRHSIWIWQFNADDACCSCCTCCSAWFSDCASIIIIVDKLIIINDKIW